MTLNYFGSNNSLASVSDGKTEVSGKYITSPNEKHTVVLGSNNEPKIKNLAMIVNGESLFLACIDKPINAVVTDDGMFIVAAVNLEKDECGLFFFDAEGKKIKKLKSNTTNIYLSPDSKYVLTQNMPDSEKSIDRILTVYEVATQQKTMKVLNTMYDAEFTFIDNSTLELTHKGDYDSPWISAKINIACKY